MSALSWNQIRANAKQFADSWKDASYEKGETQSFYNEFFEVFGHRRRNVAVYERKVKMLNNNQGFIDLFWPGMLLVEQKSAGRNLTAASAQADDYILALPERERPRYRLVCDFQNFILTDLEARESHHFTLAELPEKMRLFDFIAGRRQQTYKDQDPVNVDASVKMSNLHKVLEDAGYKGADLERLLVRIMFCLFADDTGIFEQDSFLNYVRDRTADDGSDLGGKIIELFQVLDTPIKDRQKNLDEDLAAFPYVNGALFTDLIRTPAFNKEMRDALLDCCYFNWTKVSPALFGSLFQTVMLPEEQRQEGAHYTSERNILKTIQPLFLDDLHSEFEKIKADRGTARRKKLEEFHAKLGTLTFFDPACGCGNFLILAYRELRELELELLDQLYPKDKNGDRTGILDVGLLSKIDVDQFYGIEINEFPARIAETAMWLTDHQLNMKLGDMFGKAYARLPLQKSAHIHHENALELDWNKVLPASKCNFILGNPPFIGKKEQDKGQKADINRVFSGVKGVGVLDYVACWYLVAAKYIQDTKTKVAFVSTKSIVQGEQVGILWNEMYRHDCRIFFAHRTFKWTIDEKKVKGLKIANVHVVIVGFCTAKTDSAIIYDYETVTSDPHAVICKNINPYLVDAPSFLIEKRSTPISSAPFINKGSEATDFGHLTLTHEEYMNLISDDQDAAKWIKKFIGGDELINGMDRYCLWMQGISPSEIRLFPSILERVSRVQKERLRSNKERTRDWANRSWLFSEDRQPKKDYLAIPKVSSETRFYLPISFCSVETIASGSLLVIPDATNYHFGILSSVMHNEWMRYTAGRMKSDYQYSATIVYNNFPWPDAKPEQEKVIADKAQAVLDARAQFPDSTLADLYNPLTMPAPLRKAHTELDKAVDKAYRFQPFTSELERIQFLFERYQQLVEPLTAAMSAKPKKKKSTK